MPNSVYIYRSRCEWTFFRLIGSGFSNGVENLAMDSASGVKPGGEFSDGGALLISEPMHSLHPQLIHPQMSLGNHFSYTYFHTQNLLKILEITTLPDKKE